MAVALVGALAGWLLTRQASKEAREEERKHQQRLRVRDREIDAAMAMDDALLRVGPALPTVGADQAQGFRVAYQEWERGLRRSSILAEDAPLLGRYQVVGLMLWMAMADALIAGRSDQTRGSLSRAIMGARQALAAFRREEPLPDPIFPTKGSELYDLVPVRGREYDYGPLEDWLRENPER